MPVDFEKIKEAVEKRNEFLAQHPEYQWLQDEIDETLKKIGNNHHNRQAAIQTMMLNTWFRITKLDEELKKKKEDKNE